MGSLLRNNGRKHDHPVGSFKHIGLTSYQEFLLGEVIDIYDDVAQQKEPNSADRSVYDNGWDEGASYALSEMVEAIVNEGQQIDATELKRALYDRGLLL